MESRNLEETRERELESRYSIYATLGTLFLFLKGFCLIVHKGDSIAQYHSQLQKIATTVPLAAEGGVRR
jgi:hypothetical protein